MEETGFDVLDNISTQESLLEWWETVQTVASGDRVHTLQLFVPFLLCGRIADAETEIRISHAQCVSALQSYRNRVDQGYIPRDYTYEQRVREKADNEMHLWTCLNELNFNNLYSYMRDNYLRNISWIRKYGIPMTQHTPLSIFR